VKGNPYAFNFEEYKIAFGNQIHLSYENTLTSCLSVMPKMPKNKINNLRTKEDEAKSIEEG